VHVDTVLVDDVVDNTGRTVEAVIPVDLRVGVTVAEGLVNAAGLPSLSTRGLMGTVAEVAAVPALLGSGRGLLVNCFEPGNSSTGRPCTSTGLTTGSGGMGEGKYNLFGWVEPRGDTGADGGEIGDRSARVEG